MMEILQTMKISIRPFSTSKYVLALAFGCASFFAIAADFKSEMLVGTWIQTEFLPNGAKAQTLLTMNKDGTYKVSGTLEQKPIMNYSGKWAFTEDKITSTVLKSDMPATEVNKVYIDTVMILNEREMVTKSNGKRQTWLKSK